MLAAPTAWAASVLDSRYAGSSFDASAGPTGGFGPGGGGGPVRSPSFRPGSCPGRAGRGLPGGRSARRRRAGWRNPERPGERGTGERGGFGGAGGFAGAGGPGGGGGLGGGIFGSTSLTASQQQLYRYVSAHRDGAGYLLAVSSWSEASAYILATGQEVMPMGGFSGSVPEPTLARVQATRGHRAAQVLPARRGGRLRRPGARRRRRHDGAGHQLGGIRLRRGTGPRTTEPPRAAPGRCTSAAKVTAPARLRRPGLATPGESPGRSTDSSRPQVSVPSGSE